MCRMPASAAHNTFLRVYLDQHLHNCGEGQMEELIWFQTQIFSRLILVQFSYAKIREKV